MNDAPSQDTSRQSGPSAACSDFDTRFSVGALLLPMLWYLVHRDWWRAAYFFGFSVVVGGLYAFFAWGDSPAQPLLDTVRFAGFYGVSAWLARSARRRAIQASVLYHDSVAFAKSERGWTIAGLVCLAITFTIWVF